MRGSSGLGQSWGLSLGGYCRLFEATWPRIGFHTEADLCGTASDLNSAKP